MLNISLTMNSNTPVESGEGPVKHLHIHWHGAAAQFVLEALNKHGGSMGEFITDAMRFYFWYMTTTDHSTIISVPHGKISSGLRLEMDKVGAQTLKLHS